MRARIVTEQQSGELIVFDQRHGVTVLPVLHRDTDAVSKKLPNIDRILGHLHGCHQSLGSEQGAGRLQLPRGKSIADHGVGSNFERSDSVQEFFLCRFEQRQIRFIIDHLYVGRGLLSGLGALEFDVILICNQVRSDKDAPVGQHRAERPL